MPFEQLLSVNAIYNGDAESTTKHFKESVKEFVPYDQVAFVSTKISSVYVGKHTGIMQRTKSDVDLFEQCKIIATFV